MAIKERLLKQLNIVRDGLNAMPPFHSRDLNAMRNALVQARDLCFQGLPSGRFSDYQDVYDGLLLAIDQLAEGAEDGQTIASLCRDLFQYLSVQTQKETSFKKEIVFLPYQASMWDSLESVWKAANEDKAHCIAYVMPIPYADLTPEHTVAQWHCEKDIFPKDVPTLDWQTVDLEEMHPDVIFIHNPYDQYNAVTSVESRYYSSHLKECTYKLVYIPYAVEEEVQPGNEAIEEKISHRALQPGVLNAHLVIAQSEDTRQAWINILVRHTNVKDRALWERRILGLGSPKIDKVLTDRREDFDMPEKWQKLIAGKKVILYNTSLGAMLQNTDQVCNKLRYVFDIFRNREDVVLWWRPHPLMKSTFHSMRPRFEEEYCQIEKRFIEEGWGIYDDSPDLHRAICWSDVYYGDFSSVHVLYAATGKKVLKQCFYPWVNQNSTWLHVSGAFFQDKDIFFFPDNLSGAFVFHTMTGQLELCSIIEDGWAYRKLRSGWHIGDFSQNGRLCGIVQYGKSFYIYDTLQRSFQSIAVPKEFTDGELVHFYGAYQVENDVWLVPHHGRAVGQYNLENGKFLYYPEIFSLVQDHWNGVFPIFGDFVQARGSLWILYAQGNRVLQFDISSKKAYSYGIDNHGSQIAYIEYDEGSFWLYDTTGVLMKWTPETGIQKKIVDPLGVTRDFGSIKCIDGKIWIVASNQDVYGVMDCKTEEVQIYREKMNRVEGEIGSVVLREAEGYLYVLPYDGNVLVRIDTQYNAVKSWKIELTDTIQDMYRQKYIKAFRSGDYEWDRDSILYLMDSLWEHESTSVPQLAGKRIYESV